jgi:hypothetical protein
MLHRRRVRMFFVRSSRPDAAFRSCPYGLHPYSLAVIVK